MPGTGITWLAFTPVAGTWPGIIPRLGSARTVHRVPIAQRQGSEQVNSPLDITTPVLLRGKRNN